MKRRLVQNSIRLALWLLATSTVGATIGLTLTLFINEFAWPTVIGSMVFANVVGLTVVIVSWVLFPRARVLGPWAGGSLLVLALASGSLLGTVTVFFAFPLFVLRDVRQALAIGVLNGLLALVVGGVLYTYEGLRRRLQDSLREVEEIRLHEAELTAQAARAELSALQAQINPHFFFNTLNTISSLLGEDAETADDLLLMLSDLFRYTFKASGKPVRLKQELDFIQRYLAIEHARFGDRLQVEWRIEDEARELQVPGLILQPLVENAVQHGISPSARGGRVLVSANLIDRFLRLEVHDNGAGISSTEEDLIQEGHGLGNVARRIEVLFRGRAKLEITRDGTDTVSRLLLPLSDNTDSQQGEP